MSHIRKPTRVVLVLLIPLALTLSYVHQSRAQVVYTWTDEEGVVHFSDTPPQGVTGVEERKLQAPEPVRRGADLPVLPPQDERVRIEDESEQPQAQPAPAVQEPTGQFEGPARIIVAARKSVARGPRTHHVTGSVKNVGGQTASDVRVRLHIVAQGNPCDEAEAEVAPPTLEPGQTGYVDTTIESPCFLDEASIDLEPYWR